MPTTTEEIRIGGIAIRYLLDGSTNENSLTMFEFDVAPGAKVPIAHSHDAYDETGYGLEGTLTMTLWDKSGNPTTREIGPGEVIFIPRGVVHRFDNLHPTTAKGLSVITPGILSADYFREIAAVLKTAMSAGTPPSPAALGEVMQRHGLTSAPTFTL